MVIMAPILHRVLIQVDVAKEVVENHNLNTLYDPGDTVVTNSFRVMGKKSGKEVVVPYCFSVFKVSTSRKNLSELDHEVSRENF